MSTIGKTAIYSCWFFFNLTWAGLILSWIPNSPCTESHIPRGIVLPSLHLLPFEPLPALRSYTWEKGQFSRAAWVWGATRVGKKREDSKIRQKALCMSLSACWTGHQRDFFLLIPFICPQSHDPCCSGNFPNHWKLLPPLLPQPFSQKRDPFLIQCPCPDVKQHFHEQNLSFSWEKGIFWIQSPTFNKSLVKRMAMDFIYLAHFYPALCSWNYDWCTWALSPLYSPNNPVS